MSVYYYCCLFLYRLSPETFGYTLVHYHTTLVSVAATSEVRMTAMLVLSVTKLILQYVECRVLL
jgi:hypothetical protein